MFLSLIVISMMSHASSDLSAGMAMESRVEPDVNNEVYNARNVGQLYAKLRQWPWALLIEAGSEERDSSSGSLHIDAQTTDLASWGRYEFRAKDLWSPYAAGGVGAYLDKVDTSFQSSRVQRTGVRKMLGLGAGVTKTFNEKLLVEVEGRSDFVEQSEQPVFSVLFRLGYQIY